MDKVFKTIVPGLITFDTKLNGIKDFGLSENFNFYKSQVEKQKFHYSLMVENDIEIPLSYDFRNGYYFKKDGCWYYFRKIFKGLSLKFKYDPKNKVFYFNRLYTKILFGLGGIRTIGEHIFDFISLDLLLNDYVIFLGCAYYKENKTICIIGPSFNGKTSLIKSILKKEGKYIAEEKLIINFKENKVYPNSPHLLNHFRTANKGLLNLNKNQIIDHPMRIDDLSLLQNSLGLKNGSSKKKDLSEYLLICSLFFLNNLMVRSFIVEEGLLESLTKKIEDIKKIKKYNFVNINNFRYIIE